MRKIIKIVILFFAVVPSMAQSLDSLQQMALRNNHTLRNARIETKIADEDKAVAFTKYFPSVSASAMGFIAAKDMIRTEMDLTNMGQMIAPTLIELGMQDMLAQMPTTYEMSMLKSGVTANVLITQPLFAGGQIVNGNKLAVLQQEIRRLQVKMNEKQIVQSVTDYYWQIASLDANLLTLDAAQIQLDSIHQLTENYVNAGLINRNDLLTVELKQQEIKSNKLKVENARKLLLLVLAQLCGQTENIESFVVHPTSVADASEPSNYFVQASQAVYQREEFELAGKAVEAKNLQVKMERGKYLPTVAVGATGLYNFMHLGGDFLDMKNGNFVGFATVSIPITDWWGGAHSLKKAKYQLQQAENDRMEAQEKLQIDILAAWNNLTEAYSQIEIARKSVVSAAENLRLQQDQYRAGTSLMSDLLDAVTLNVKAQASLTSAQAEYQMRKADYLRKTGQER